MANSRHTSRIARRFLDGAHAHLIPSERNNHVPHALKHHVLVGYSLILILLKALVLSAYVLLPAASVYSSAVTADNIVNLTNAARSALGLSTLRIDERLARAAIGKAEDMVLHQYFAHNSPAGLTPWHWIRGQKYDYRHAGENLAVHLFSAEGVQEGWMASPTHRDNIISTKYQDIGVGVARGIYEGYDTVFVVEMFGTLKQAEPQPALAAQPVPEPAPEIQAAVAPTEEGYKVTLQEGRVEAATAMIADQAVPMQKNASGMLEAVVPVDKQAIEPDGERVYVTFVGASGTQEVSSVAIVAPKARSQCGNLT